MKITRKQLRKLIKEEVKRLDETQVALGLSHNFSNEELYQHTLNFISQNPILQPGTVEYEKAEGLLSILSNRVVQVVKYDEYSTTNDEMAHMREMQGRLKMAKRALMQAMGKRMPDARLQSWRQGRRDDFRRQSEEFDEKGVSRYSSERPWHIRKRHKF